MIQSPFVSAERLGDQGQGQRLYHLYNTKQPSLEQTKGFYKKNYLKLCKVSYLTYLIFFRV